MNRCEFEGCTTDVYSRGYCQKHYDYLRNRGLLPKLNKPPADRYLEKVDVRGPDQCWPWLGAHTTPVNGRAPYGQIRWNGRTRNAIRAGWEVHNGAYPPDDYDVCHTCDNPGCQNPRHWFLGTRADNLRDMWAKGRGGAPPRTTTVEQDAEARRLLQTGLSQRAVVEQLCISRWVVAQIALDRRK